MLRNVPDTIHVYLLSLFPSDKIIRPGNGITNHQKFGTCSDHDAIVNPGGHILLISLHDFFRTTEHRRRYVKQPSSFQDLRVEWEWPYPSVVWKYSLS